MTINSSDANSNSEENFATNVFLFWIYFGQGIFLLTAYVLIFGAIVFHEPLRQRKEYIIIAGLAFINIGEGFGFFTAGLIRNLYIINGTAGKLISRVACLLKPWNIAFMWSSPLSYIYLLLISIDRFIAIRFPLKYYVFTTRYAYCLVGGTFLFMFVNVFIGIVFTLPYSYPEVSQICFTQAAFVNGYYEYNTWFSLACDFLSILVYAVVIYLSFKMIRPIKNDQRITAPQRKAMDQQRKITKTLAICSLCTFLFNCIPLMANLFLIPFLGGALDRFIPYTSVINNLSPISDFFTYILRQRELRIGVVHLLKCNRLTEAAVQVVAASWKTTPASSKPANRDGGAK